MTPFTLVVVCHSRDIDMLRLQARSIARYVPRALIDHILVIWNDSRYEEFTDVFATKILREYGGLHDLVRLYHRDDIAPHIDFSHGWRSQQILKILSARLVTTEFMLILDAKNHFIRPIDAMSYIHSDGRLKTYKVSQRGHLEKMFQNSFKIFDIDFEQFVDACLPNITPFPARSGSVLAMTDMIEATEKTDFSTFFLEHDIAEFYLFAAFIAWRDGTLSQEYVFEDMDVVTIFADKANPGAFEWVDMQIQQETTLSFGIHWQAINLLPDSLKSAIAAFWVERRLVRDIEEGLDFLN